MSEQNREFQEHLLAIFKVEAREHLDAMSSLLLGLESRETDAGQGNGRVETLFREAHSLKGAARAVNCTAVESFCQALESLLARLKRGELALSPALFDLLHQAAEHLGALLDHPALERSSAELIRHLQHPAEGMGTRRTEAASLEPKLATPEVPVSPHPVLVPMEEPVSPSLASAPEEEPAIPPGQAEAPASAPLPRPPATETVRIATAKLDALLHRSEELLAAQMLFGHLVQELRVLYADLSAWDKRQAGHARPARSLLRGMERNGAGRGTQEDAQLKKLLEELAAGETAVKSLAGKSARLLKTAEQDRRTFGGLSADLQEEVKRLLMLPVSSLTRAFPNMVRTLARERNKLAELTVEGGDLEIDRRILEEIKDPLIHLLRNCIDHGVESPEERRRLNKPPQGRIRLAIAPQSGDKVEIALADDGAGIDLAKARAAAARLDLLAGDPAAPCDREILPLIFESGFTTSAYITDLSGRGLGLAIVREKVEKLGGAVAVETQAGQGSTFRLRLPLTLAAFRGVLVRVGETPFVLPSSQVERTLRLEREAVQTVENRETVPLDGATLALVRLDDLLELPRRSSASDAYLYVAVIAAGGMRIALRVDEIVEEREILAKKLQPPLLRVRYVSGATLMGGGKIVLILDASDLVKAAAKATPPVQPPAPDAMPEPPGRRLLVVEDSITTRTLLKNLLETAGYAVETAVDGIDAYTRLRSEAFDLVVSDVDMPRMNGFDLTRKIRGDGRLAELPVVLVTALESREDRERGIDAGANAYLVKRSFDQSNLLDAVRRLL